MQHTTPTAADLIDMMIQGIEANEPGAVISRLNPGAVGFRCHLPHSPAFHVRVEQPRGFWDAELMDDEAADTPFNDHPGEE